MTSVRKIMTVDQIAMVAATMATKPRGANRFVDRSNELSTADAAAAAGIPETAVKSAKAVLREAPA